jgi:hypothetical protein
MDKDLDTGVEEPQAAAVDGEGTEDLGDYTPSEFEDEPEEEQSLAELLEEEETEKVVESGGDNPPDESGEEEQQEPQEEPAPNLNEGIDRSKAFAERLREETQKIEQRVRAEMEKKYAPAKEAEIELAARKLIEENPKMEMSLDMAKMLVRAQQQQQPEEQSDVTPEDDKEASFKAWKQSWIDEEPLLKIALNDPNATVLGHSAKDPVFKAELSTGLSPIAALEQTKKLRAIFNQEISAAKASGQKDVLQKLKDSNARATTPISSVKSTGKARSETDYIQTAPMDELMARLEKGPIRFGKG